MVKKIFALTLLVFTNTFSKQVYDLKKNDPIDIVIVSHEKDKRTLDHCINGIKKNCKNVGNIYVVSEKKLTNNPNAQWFDEAIFPFSKRDIATAIFESEKEVDAFCKSPRLGWLYKQIVCLYSPLIIPQISSNVLALDADTIFLNPVEFIDGQGNTLFNPGTEYEYPYFIHAAKLIKGQNRIYKYFPHYSGIAHHQLFQRAIIEDLFAQISQSNNNMEPWRSFAKHLDKNELPRSAMSEFEIYFNFAFAQTDQVRIRELKWINIKWNPEHIINYGVLGYHYISCHTWMD